MGIFKKVFKGIGKVFKKIGKGVKKVFKKFGKFMGKIGIVGQIAMMFILPGIGAALMKGFGAMWTGVVGQTAAQATAAAAGQVAGQAAVGGITSAAGQAAVANATAATAASIQAGTTAITSTATGMLGSSSAVLRGAGMVLEKGAQFARTIQAGFKTVSQAVTGAFTETGKWIGGKLGMKTAEGAAMQGSWANYSKGVTDSFAKLGDKAAEFWSPIKAGPATASPITDAVTNKAVEAVSTPSNFMAEAADTGSGITTDISMPTAELKNQIGKVTESTFTSPTGFDVTDTTNLNRSLLDRATTYVAETPGRLYEGAKDFIVGTPGRVLKSEATGALYDAAGLTPEQQVMEEQSRFGGYVPEFRGNADVYAQTMGYDFQQFIAGNEEQFGPYGEPEGQFGGANAYRDYYNKLQNSGAMA